MRSPPDLSGFSPQELRCLLIRAVRLGNQPQHTSPLLHTSSKLAKVQFIFAERRYLYSNYVCRWPLDCCGPPAEGANNRHLGYVDLADSSHGRLWLSDNAEDPPLMQSMLEQCRKFAGKDSEIVFFQKPPLDKVEWYDCRAKKWASAAETLSVELKDNAALGGREALSEC